MAEGQTITTTIISKVQQNQYFLYGVFAGLVVGWWFGGFKGDNTGYLMVAAVVIYIWYNSRSKPKGKTIYDVAKELALIHKDATGETLDSETFECFWRGGDIHFFQFTNPTWEITTKCKVTGPHERTHRSAKSMKNERDNQYVDTGVYEID